MSKSVELVTGELFGQLWPRLSDEQYRESVELFRARFLANGFDLSWFSGKKCLDAGTGSGRYAVAMAMHGARVVGCDVSESGLATARERAKLIPGLTFARASVLNLPFPDASFDFICCAGVLHHTPSIERGLDEITRVLRPGGRLFLLLYGAGGLRWKMVKALRPLCAELGLEAVDRAIAAAGLPANNRKNALDDLFVPIQTLVRWSDLSGWLTRRGFTFDRWTKGRFDHEASTEAQLQDMRKLASIADNLSGPLGTLAGRISAAFCDTARDHLDNASLVLGEGNHRVLATLQR
jgi:SAM-dependent methyltransferase